MKYLDENVKLNDILTDEVTIVDYYADWCGPCKMLEVELEELTDITVIKVDTEKHMQLAMEKKIMSIPYVEIYKNKALVTSFMGFKTKDEIVQTLNNI